jgi:uncharacterized protein (TIGR03435 family)
LPAFEAASVKPNPSATGVNIGIQNGRMRFTGVTVRQLLVRAYGVQPFEIIGGPGWLSSDRFDLVAKAPERATLAEINLMIRALLVDRFGLSARVEQRESPVFMLVVNRDDGKLGPAIAPAAGADCQSPGDERCRMLVGFGVLEGTGQPMRLLASTLTNIVGRPVVDMTFLEGRYDFKVTFTPDNGRGAGREPEPPSQPVPDAPSIFTALQEQLGLKLDRERGPVDVVVIDSIRRPSPD